MIDAVLLLVAIFVVHLVYEYFRRKSMLDNVNNKYILITGCDTGFGNSLAKRLDNMGCHVFAACFTTEGAERLHNACSSRLKTLQLDVTNVTSIEEAFEYVSSQIPSDEGLWGLVNNAGITSTVHIPFEFSLRKDFQNVLDVNLLGMIDMCKTFMPLLKTSKGRIVNTASIAGRVSTMPNNLPYFVSKWGVEAFSDCLRIYTQQYGIQVAILEPSLFKTDLINESSFRRQVEEGYARMPQEYKDTVLAPDYVEKVTASLLPIMDMANPRLHLVVDAYVHGLFGVHPKKRYTVGWDAYFLYIPSSYFPSIITDFIFGKLHYKMFVKPFLR